MRAFSWGRIAYSEPDQLESLVGEPRKKVNSAKVSLDEFIETRAADLKEYQNQVYADRFKVWLDKVSKAEKKVSSYDHELEEAVARSLYKLMAYKDEYEVARLYSSPVFSQKLNSQFSGKYTIGLNFAPPIFARKDPVTGNPKISSYNGRWMFSALKVLARFKFLRGTRFDPFGYHEDRRSERQLLDDYEQLLERFVKGLTHDNLAIAIELAKLPQGIRGYGHVKNRCIEEFKSKQDKLNTQFSMPSRAMDAAE